MHVWTGSKYISSKSGLIATFVNDVNVLNVDDDDDEDDDNDAYLTLKAFSVHVFE